MVVLENLSKIIFCIFLSINALAQNKDAGIVNNDLRAELLLKGVQSFERFKDDNIDILYTEHAGVNKMSVYSQDKNVKLFEDSMSGNSFIKAEIIYLKAKPTQPLVLSLWTRGVHAYELRIYDPSQREKKMVFSQTSDFMIDWKIEKYILKVLLNHGDLDPQSRKPVEKTITWDGSLKK